MPKFAEDGVLYVKVHYLISYYIRRNKTLIQRVGYSLMRPRLARTIMKTSLMKTELEKQYGAPGNNIPERLRAHTNLFPLDRETCQTNCRKQVQSPCLYSWLPTQSLQSTFEKRTLTVETVDRQFLPVT